MKYVTKHYEYTLELLAGRICTPERYGAVALQDTVEMDLSSLADIPLFSLSEVGLEN
jgi:hypothetical protein